MQLQRKPLAILAAALLAAGGANAAITLPSTGNSSLLLVAVDQSSPIQLTVNLGYLISDVIPLTASGQGFAAAGTNIVWDFKTNTRTVNGVASTAGFSWSNEFANFAGTANTGSVKWAVLGADSSSVGASANIIPGRNFVGTGNLSAEQMLTITSAGNVSAGASAFNSFVTSSNQLGTHGTATYGANTTSGGGSYLFNPGGLGATYNAGNSWDYLVDNGVSSTFQYAQSSQANPYVFQVGSDLNGSQSSITERAAFSDILSSNPGHFTFDANAGTLTWAVAAPVPEPEAYAMLIAGLAAVAAFARRRKAESKA